MIEELAVCVGPEHDPGRYVLGRLVEVGGEGRVYEAVVTTGEVERKVAVKVLHDSSPTQVRGASARWRERKELIARLDVAGVAPVEEVFVGPALDERDAPAGVVYIVMPWYRGSNLLRWRETHQGEPVESLLLDLIPLADTIDRLHRGVRGVTVVHGDVTPANVLVHDLADGRRELVLVDAGGLVRVEDAADDLVGGTRGYRPPELVGGAPASVAADNFGFGATVCFVLTGSPPPQHLDGTPNVEALRAQLLVATAQIDLTGRVLAMLSPDAADRPEQCRPWLEEVVGSISMTAVPTASFRPRATRRAPRSRRTARVVAVCALALAPVLLVARPFLSAPSLAPSGHILGGPTILATSRAGTVFRGDVRHVPDGWEPWLVFTPARNLWRPAMRLFVDHDHTWTGVASGPLPGEIARLELMLVKASTGKTWLGPRPLLMSNGSRLGVAPITDVIVVDDVLVQARG